MDLGRGRFGMVPRVADADEEDEEELEETLSERFWGLTEMFPEKVRSVVERTKDYSVWAVKGGFKFLRGATWVLGTSLLVGVFPIVFEKERLDMEQVQVNQQRQMLLGPGVVQSSKSSMGSVMGMMPGGAGRS